MNKTFKDSPGVPIVRSLYEWERESMDYFGSTNGYNSRRHTSMSGMLLASLSRLALVGATMFSLIGADPSRDDPEPLHETRLA